MAWRVLVADDDPEICTLIKTILRNASFEVSVCPDAESALVHLQRDKAYDYPDQRLSCCPVFRGSS